MDEDVRTRLQGQRHLLVAADRCRSESTPLSMSLDFNEPIVACEV